MHLTAKFHHPSLNHSEVIVLTNKQTNWQTNRRRWKHTTRSAMLHRWVTTATPQVERHDNVHLLSAYHRLQLIYWLQCIWYL